MKTTPPARRPPRPLRAVLLVVGACLALAAPAEGQTAAPGRASITIADVLHLDVETGGAASEVRLKVVANRQWQLVAVLEDAGGRTWPVGVVARGGAGRVPVALSYRSLVEEAGAPESAALRFTLSAL